MARHPLTRAGAGALLSRPLRSPPRATATARPRVPQPPAEGSAGGRGDAHHRARSQKGGGGGGGGGGAPRSWLQMPPAAHHSLALVPAVGPPRLRKNRFLLPAPREGDCCYSPAPESFLVKRVCAIFHVVERLYIALHRTHIVTRRMARIETCLYFGQRCHSRGRHTESIHSVGVAEAAGRHAAQLYREH